MDELNVWDDNDNVTEAVPIELADSVLTEHIDEESDDDFGAFEEGDFEEPVAAQLQPIIDNNNQDELLTVYNGDYYSKKSKIDTILNNIFNDVDEEVNQSNTDTFQFDERSRKIFERLITEEDEYISALIWKKSMIFKQLLLNLDIPEPTITSKPVTKRPSLSIGGDQLKNMYDLMNSVSLNDNFGKLLAEVPQFEDLNINKNSEEFLNINNNTSTIISKAKIKIKENEQQDQPIDNKEYLTGLVIMKKELLRLVSIWDERMKDTKADNDLFSSYVENLIANTQKKRREKRVIKQSKHKK
jgi:hypothetical protein